LHDTRVFETLSTAASEKREHDFERGIKHADNRVAALKKICVKDQEKLQKFILFEETDFQRLLSSRM
jgi:hypothetical protein